MGDSGGRTLAVTGEGAREWVGQRRSEFDAVLVGSGTLLADDPLLTARDGDQQLLPEQPVRVIADARLRTSATARLLSEEGGAVFILTSHEGTARPQAEDLAAAGARVLGVDSAEGGGLDPGDMLSTLADEGIDSIFVEGGAELISAFAVLDLVDLWHFWIGRKIVGDGPGVLAQACEPPLRLGPMQTVEIDGDLLVTALPPDGI